MFSKSKPMSLTSFIRIISSTVALVIGLSACGGDDDAALPQVPAVLILKVVGSNQIDISWPAVDNTTNYELYRNTSDATGSVTLIASPTTTNYSDTGLVSGTSYYYWLKICNTDGCSDDFYLVASATTLAQSYNVHAEIGASDTLIKYYTTEVIDYYRTTEKNCNLANYSLCTNSTLVPFPENSTNNANKDLSSFTDNFMTLDNLINNPQPTYVHLVTGNQTLTVDVSANRPRFSTRSSHQSAVLNNEIYVIGGYDGDNKNDVWKSSDGVNWTEVTASASFSARYDHQAIVLKNEIYVIGGFDDGAREDDVWKSSDGGVSWIEVTASADFSARSRHQAVVFNNEIYVIGGNDGNRKNDVWRSSDGANWTIVTASAGFSTRSSHQSAVLKNEIYVIGGNDGNRKNDVWKSSDEGATWTEMTASASFSARVNHQSVVLNNGIYVIGGWDGARNNDVWKYYPSSTNQEWRLLRAIHSYQE